MALRCSRHGTLPESGGIFDQPYKLTYTMEVLENVYRAHRSMVDTRKDMKKWSEEYPAHWEIVRRVQTLRLEMNNG